ncbi:MAG TPA: carboxypeptidase-like regulatory domain-containing protein, partial [Pyrinomonadaceae bacterium]|nr:carboxypeptidase-like regulatory domain-containing protein [Pyrinomonadaceae bacterium]
MMLRKWMAAAALCVLSLTVAFAQDKTTGGFKGKVRAENGSTVTGVAVIVRQGEREAARVETNRKGEFLVTGLKPGTYGLSFRKAGLSTGTLENQEVRAGKVRELDRLVLFVDEASLASLRGSVFTPDGRSAPNVRVELYRIGADGAEKKIGERLSSEETGQFVFRLSPDPAKYIAIARGRNGETVRSEVVQVDGPAIYRTVISLPPPTQ